MRAYDTYEIQDTRYEIRNTGSTGVAVTVVVTIRQSVFGQGGARREASMSVVDAVAQRQVRAERQVRRAGSMDGGLFDVGQSVFDVQCWMIGSRAGKKGDWEVGTGNGTYVVWRMEACSEFDGDTGVFGCGRGSPGVHESEEGSGAWRLSLKVERGRGIVRSAMDAWAHTGRGSEGADGDVEACRRGTLSHDA